MQNEAISINFVNEELICDAFLDSVFDMSHSKMDSLSLTQTRSLSSANDEVVSRGKGRPKGEKNSNNPLKRTKSVLRDENQRKGHWSTEENKKYHWFLEVYSNHFIFKEMRRLDKIFKTMSMFIGSREAEQCRSHHQKMEKKYNSFTNIILFLRNLHYSEEGTHLLEQDLISNEIAITDTLLSAKELKNVEFLKSKSMILSVSEEAKVDCDVRELKEDSYLDFLGEDYERRFEIDDLLF